MKTITEAMESLKENKLTEERYYYGEIEHVKDMIKNNIMKNLIGTANFIKENITSENP